MKTAIAALSAAAALGASAPAWAQDDASDERGSERFFFDAEKEVDPDETAVDGAITSSSFYYRESGRQGPPLSDGRPAPDTASSTDRVFTDLRLQLDAHHISGSKWEFRGDVRGRLAPELCEGRIDALTMMEVPCEPAQSGTFGGTELEAREFYLHRTGAKTDVAVGRQFVLELAAVKFDGVKLTRRASDRWRYLAFAGAYPQRSSRDLRDDYPRARSDVDPLTGDPIFEGKRIVPITGGVGAAYRYRKAYGSFGLVGILPLADEQQVAESGAEPARVFATASGYYRHSNELDVYHYLVLDGTGPDGAGLTNLTLGVNYRPKPNVRTYLQVNRIDTETLNVTAERELENVDENDAVDGQIQNNIEVMRIAQESARAGVSVAFDQNRYDVSVLGALRRRPEIEVPVLGGGTFVFPRSQAADITLRAVDRRSFYDLRLGAGITRTLGLSDDNTTSADAWIARVDGSREVLGGRGELEANLSYIQATDENRGALMCGTGADPLQCFGTSSTRVVSAGALLFYRPKKQWYLVGSGNLGLQKLTTVGAMGGEAVEVPQPNILLFTAFLRVAYRF